MTFLLAPSVCKLSFQNTPYTKVRSGYYSEGDSRRLRYYQKTMEAPAQQRLLTEKEQQSLTADVVQTALHRGKPLQPFTVETSHSQAPLVDFLADAHANRNRFMLMLSAVGAGVALAIGLGTQSRIKMVPPILWVGAVMGLGGLIGAGIGGLFGTASDGTQRWVNDWILTMIGMTSPKTPIGEAVQYLPQRTNKSIEALFSEQEQYEVDRANCYDLPAGSQRGYCFSRRS